MSSLFSVLDAGSIVKAGSINAGAHHSNNLWRGFSILWKHGPPELGGKTAPHHRSQTLQQSCPGLFSASRQTREPSR